MVTSYSSINSESLLETFYTQFFSFFSLHGIYLLSGLFRFRINSRILNLICDSSVGMALPYGLEDRGSRVRFPAVAGNFSLPYRVQIGSGAHPPPIQRVPGSLSLGVKWPVREADHLPPSSAEVEE
jgi:hypothetical protein